MKALAIDIETTGLDPKVHSITEFAAVLFDTHEKHPGPIKTFYRWVNPQGFVWDAFCLTLHHAWIKKVLDRIKVENISPKDEEADGPVICLTHTALVNQFATWLFTECNHPVPKDGKWEKLTAAGKNFGGFDSQFLITHGFPAMFRHRALDPGPLYVTRDDPFPPELKECKARAIASGCMILSPDVAHNALDDAMDVATLLRHKYAR